MRSNSSAATKPVPVEFLRNRILLLVFPYSFERVSTHSLDSLDSPDFF